MEPVRGNQIIDAVVFGNGESRKRINLDIDLNQVTKIGCNAIHRDMSVDYLICCDRRMVEESVINPATTNTKIYTREDWARYYRKIKKHRNVFVVPPLPYHGTNKADKPEHWGSGCYAVLLAASLEFKDILIVGFDLYPNGNKVNNIYKGTSNYSRPDAQGIDYSFWVYQISKVFQHYPNTKFVIAHLPGWEIPNLWKKNNVKFKEFNPEPLTNLNTNV